MRFQFKLEVIGENRFLPVDYQYFLSCSIFKLIQKSDANYANFLHNEGFRVEGKTFKLFTVSSLSMRPFVLHKQKGVFEIPINCNLEVEIGIWIKETASNLLQGIFKNEIIHIGDRYNTVALRIKSVKSSTISSIPQTIRYKTFSPILIKWQHPRSNEILHLSPDDSRFEELLLLNLEEKLKSKQLHSNSAQKSCVIDDSIRFKLLSKPRKNGVVIKKGTIQETKNIGYQFEFDLTAPKELHEAGMYAGFGVDNSMGFGYCKAQI